MRRIRHKVRIKVRTEDGSTRQVLEVKTITMRERLLRLIFGEMAEVMMITSSGRVEGIEIAETGGR